MDKDFAINGPLVRRRMPRIWFLFIGSHLAPRFFQTTPHSVALALRYHFSSIRM
jgi:hypothetical protein